VLAVFSVYLDYTQKKTIW